MPLEKDEDFLNLGVKELTDYLTVHWLKYSKEKR